MVRGPSPQISWNLSLKQHAGQFPIHTQLRSVKIDRMFVYVADMHPRMNESLGWSACMYVGRGIYFRLSSTPLLVRFGPFYSLYLGQVIPA